jgi:hypothetical protein
MKKKYKRFILIKVWNHKDISSHSTSITAKRARQKQYSKPRHPRIMIWDKKKNTFVR